MAARPVRRNRLNRILLYSGVGTAAKAVFKKYPGGEMRNPDYSDKAMARARDPELFTGDASKFDSWITAFSDKI
ncbi:hypothetical protein E4U50_000375 [Claviceps purpurea]|nr:hypothetical protein E4U50_000375 [Claviceps purpurea]